MASSNLLGTSTVSFLELVGNGRTYSVPPYQRDYSWKEEQWEDLWADIADLRAERAGPHYMGALVVEQRSDRDFQVIDGQQRLATLTVLALAVIEKLHRLAERGVDPEDNRDRASGLRARFVGEKDPASLIERSKLVLNETDDGFFQDYLVQLRSPLNPLGLVKSNRQLWECFRYFRGRLDEVPAFDEDGKALAELLSETVGRDLMFILITVDDKLNAYTVFETLNARGIELSTTDLLKNYLFSQVNVGADLEALQRRWRILLGTIRPEKFPELLRFHLQVDVAQVRTPRVFKLVRQRVRTAVDVFALMDDLERRAELYAALADPGHGYWVDLPAAQRFVRELKLFRVRQMMPLLFVAWEQMPGPEFVRVLKFVATLSFRYTVVSGLNPSALEKAYHQAARDVVEGRATRAGHVARSLTSIYVEDDRFKLDFSRLELQSTGQSRRLAKYVLARLEHDASGRPVDPETDTASIEHVLPQNPSDAWGEDFPRQKWDAYIHRVGNLTLLEPALNKAGGSKGFEEKTAIYQRSRYALTERIPNEASEWTPDHVDSRGAQLAARAAEIWRSDFHTD